jgi:hypothetical protein
MRYLSFTALLLLCSGLALHLMETPVVSAQYKIEGWPIKKAWGPVRGNYVDPKTRELRFIFEDVRIVTVDIEAKTAVLLVEMKRE